MSLSTVSAGNTVLAADINQLVNVLQRASGQTETGRYHITSSAYATNANVGCYINSLSRVSTPVSVSIDTSGGTTNIGGVATFDLTANGFKVAGTAIQGLDVEAAGNYTIQY